MQNFIKFISKHLFIYICILILIIILDIIIIFVSFQGMVNHLNDNSPVQILQKISDSLTYEKASYTLENNSKELLVKNKVWSIVISEDGERIWEFNIPKEIPTKYTIQDIAALSKGYLNDYPVFIRNKNRDLLILGFPKNSYTKILSNYLPIPLIKKVPIIILIILLTDCGILFVGYYLSKRNIGTKVMPIISGLNKLSKGESVSVHIKGELSEIGQSINKTSLLLKNQDQARANWISGVSHDIRTPLSMIMGYADTIVNTKEADNSIKSQANIIKMQGIKIKELIQDLNLVSQLDYNMQLLHKDKIFLCKLLREIVTEYLNNELDEKYDIDLEIDNKAEPISFIGDTRLINRAIQNIISNSINHNPDGCLITIRLIKNKDSLALTISDNGVGISQEKLNNIIEAPHYLNSIDDRLDLRHGLGILLVQQIISMHNGKFTIDSEINNGFKSIITLYYNN